jgi:hypothetical protein
MNSPEGKIPMGSEITMSQNPRFALLKQQVVLSKMKVVQMNQ